MKPEKFELFLPICCHKVSRVDPGKKSNEKDTIAQFPILWRYNLNKYLGKKVSIKDTKLWTEKKEFC